MGKKTKMRPARLGHSNTVAVWKLSQHSFKIYRDFNDWELDLIRGLLNMLRDFRISLEEDSVLWKVVRTLWEIVLALVGVQWVFPESADLYTPYMLWRGVLFTLRLFGVASGHLRWDKCGCGTSDHGEHVDAKKTNLCSEDDKFEDDIVESDIELDDTDVWSLIMILHKGKLDEATDNLTEAIMLNPSSAYYMQLEFLLPDHSLGNLSCFFLFYPASVYVKLKKPNAAIRDADAALKASLDAYLFYHDEEIALVLKKVEPNAHKIEEHRRKYARLCKERELRKSGHQKQQQQAQPHSQGRKKNPNYFGLSVIHSEKSFSDRVSFRSPFPSPKAFRSTVSPSENPHRRRFFRRLFFGDILFRHRPYHQVRKEEIFKLSQSTGGRILAMRRPRAFLLLRLESHAPAREGAWSTFRPRASTSSLA
ncbi:FAM10 family protein [Vitis vinifera]|uniref:FAM10 family protein n=1 Tax=Vitis vinifera TaxID=29760 RepID=A0A438K9F1_VITVI|nr:FAM10 family protein [Vitis vinifera]